MRNIINLNSKWAFTKMAIEIPKEMPKMWDFVNLPHTWNAIDGQDGANDYYRGTCYYAKTIDKLDLPVADRYYLEINGANSSADVYLNGKHLAQHDGGYSTWRVDITDNLERDNLLVIAVDNAPNDRVYPQVADFTFYGGLYRNVNLICVSESHFDLDYYGTPGLMVTPKSKGSDWDIEIEAFLTNSKIGQELRYTIIDKEGNTVAQTLTTDTKVTLNISNAHLWHGRKDPYLYTASIQLLEDDTVYLAIRTDGV